MESTPQAHWHSAQLEIITPILVQKVFVPTVVLLGICIHNQKDPPIQQQSTFVLKFSRRPELSSWPSGSSFRDMDTLRLAIVELNLWWKEQNWLLVYALIILMLLAISPIVPWFSRFVDLPMSIKFFSANIVLCFSHLVGTPCYSIGGGLKHVSFSPLLAKMIRFDSEDWSAGWCNHDLLCKLLWGPH